MGFDYLSFWTEEKTKKETEKEKAFKETETLKPISFKVSNETIVLENLHAQHKNLNERLYGIFRQNENKLLKELKRQN